MVFAPIILVSLICNALYCAVKIYRDFKGGDAAFGVVGLVGVLGSSGLSVTAIVAILMTSEGQLT
jgi:hypothetical protein